MSTQQLDTTRLGEYLAAPQVIACGGSWLTPTSAITAGDYATVTRLAIAARAIADEARST